jgi:hypothetical protein
MKIGLDKYDESMVEFLKLYLFKVNNMLRAFNTKDKKKIEYGYKKLKIPESLPFDSYDVIHIFWKI